MPKKFLRAGTFSALALIVALANGAAAQTLRMALRLEPSLDPHFHYLATNVGYNSHIFEQLVRQDPDGRLQPGLAESWESLSDTHWRFNLRRGVRFHDGTEFTSADVAFSFERIPALANNPGSYAGTLKSIERVEIVDPYTIDIFTDVVNTQLPTQFASNFMVSRAATEGRATSDFNTGLATIGTGPFRFVSYTPGQSIVLERNDEYWGEAPAWERVVISIMPNDASRVAGLLAGDLDLVDAVPPSYVEQLGRNPDVTVQTRGSNRLIYLKPNVGHETSDDISAVDGSPLDTNPMRDLRVRQAISLSINRPAIVDRVMNGLAIATGQLVPEGMLGYNPDLPQLPYDPDRARALLAEAGYPEGFRIRLHCTNDRYVNDGRVCQALGQMLARGGFHPEVIVQPGSVFFVNNRAPLGAYALSLAGWGSAGEADTLWNNLHPYNTDAGLGVFNSTGYSNESLNALVEEALSTIDADARALVLERAMALAVEDLGNIPLYVQTVITASAADVEYVPHFREMTLAYNARPRAE